MSDLPQRLGTGPRLELRGVARIFEQAGRRLSILRGVDLALFAGEIVGLVGPSGSGKSTLLHVAGLLERPDGGDVAIDGVSSAALDDEGRTKIRRSTLGFVYQFHFLMPEFSALENVMLPQMLAGKGRTAARARARELLAALKLGDRESHRPGRLSGGEQQRVAIARAVANKPSILLADEPTGNLDPATAEAVFDEIRALVRRTGVAALIATHNLQLAGRMDRVLRLEDGRVGAD